MPEITTIHLTAYFDQTLGFEIYINEKTNEAFMSQASYSRLSGVSYSTIRSRYLSKSSTVIDPETPGMTEANPVRFDFSKQVQSHALKGFEASPFYQNSTVIDPETPGMTEANPVKPRQENDTQTLSVSEFKGGDIRYVVKTPGGDQEIQPIGEKLFLRWVSKDMPELLLKIAEAGTRIFMYSLAGIKVVAEEPSKRSIEQGFLTALKSLDEEILKSDAKTLKLKERRLKVEIDFNNAVIEQGLDFKYLRNVLDDELDPVKVMVFQKLFKLARKRGGIIPLSVLCNQQWKTRPEIINAFNRTSRMIKSMGKVEMIKVCEEAGLYGLGIWNPAHQTFTINSI